MRRQNCLQVLLLLLLLSNVCIANLINKGSSVSTVVRVDPQSATANVGDTITYKVRVDNVNNLYGIELRFVWASTILEYADHLLKIPVETYSDGVLHKPKSILKNNVDMEEGTYELVVTSYPPAPAFYGSGIIFEMTFTVLQEGECYLYFEKVVLSDKPPDPGTPSNPIPHEKQAGYFYMPGLGDVPTASFTFSPARPVANKTVTFNASASYDPDPGGSISRYLWDFGDGYKTEVSTPIIQHVYTIIDPGYYGPWFFTVRLIVCDVERSQSNRTYLPIEIAHPRPVAIFIFSPTTPLAGQTVTFNASASYDPDGLPLVTYEWDFEGNGTTTKTTNPIAYYRYSHLRADGYTVALKVWDAENLESSIQSKKLYVSPKPVAKFTYWPSDGYAVVNKNMTFDASASLDPNPGGGITLYMWDFGDTTQENTTQPKINHAFTTTGDFEVKLKVQDAEGDLSDQAKAAIHAVTARDIEITKVEVSPTIVKLGETVAINITITNLGDVSESFTIKAYYNQTPIGMGTQWTKIGEKNVQALEPQKNKTETVYWVIYGITPYYNYYVMVNATETPHETNITNNAKTSDESVFVLGVPPVAGFIHVPNVPTVGEEVTFDASLSSHPGGRKIISYMWGFGDGSVITTTQPIINHIYSFSGTYSVNLIITDQDGLTDSAARLLEVALYYPYNIIADVGTIHFGGEIAEFYILTLRSGEPINATQIKAVLYYSNGAKHQDISGNIQLIKTGFYRIPYLLPSTTPSGTYTLLVEASFRSVKGSTLKSFLVSQKLTNWDALLVDIKEEIATILIPNLGQIKANLTEIKATLVRIEGTLGIVNSTLGEIRTDLTAINATLVSIKNMIGTVDSTLGRIEVNLSSINATLTGIIVNSKGAILAKIDYYLGTQGTITASLADINAKVAQINWGDIATIKSDVGTIKIDASSIKTSASDLQTTATTPLYLTSIFSAAATILAVIVLSMLRKMRK